MITEFRRRRACRPPVFAIAAAIILATGLVAVPGDGGAQTFRPFDEGPRDRSFAAFRRALIKIVDARDLTALQRHFHKGIRVGFGGQDGRAEAVKAMRGDDKRWRTLARILRQGGRFERTKWRCRAKDGAMKPCVRPGFIAPYTYWANPPKDRDNHETLVITATRVNIRAAPRPDARILTRLSYRIVTTPKKSRSAVPEEWVEIELPGGKRGFIARRFVVSPIDFRVGFVKENRRWQMTFFLAGD